MQGEEQPRSETEETRGGKDLERAQPTRGSSIRDVGAALLTIVVAIIAAFLTSRCDAGAHGTRLARASDGVGETETDQPSAAPRELSGRALIELASEDGSSSAKPSAASLADPALAEMFESLPAWTLAPPERCVVQAWADGKPIGSAVGCDGEGRYQLSLPGDVAGVVFVEILIPGHIRGVLDIDVSASDATALELPTVALGPGHTVAGQTVDARGEPLADVIVQALPQPGLGEPIPWRTISDAEGRFEFTTLPYGPISLRAIKPGYALSVVEALSPEDAVLMVLDQLIDLRGSVIADAELLARAQVRLEGSSVWPAIEQPLASDGGFVFERLPDGVYGVEVTVPAGEPGGQEFASVPLENITPDLRINLALVPAFRVPVRVVDPEGEPVPGARVTLGYSQIGMLQKSAEADGEGRASVGPVVPGPYFVHADADGFLPPEPIEVEVGMQGFEGKEQVLVLIRPARIEGVVVDQDDRPIEGAEVMIDGEVAFSVGEGDTRRQMFAVAIGARDGSLGVTRGEVPDIPLFPEDETGSIASVVTDADGKFEIDMLLPGAYRIWAVDGQHAASAVASLELRSGELRGNLRLQLREGVPLTGVVRTSNGQAIAGVQVDLGDGLILTTDDRGVFDAGYRQGKQTLILRGPGMIPKQIEIDVGRDALDLELSLEPAQGRFEGRVVDGNGQPIPDVEVELRPLDGLSPSLITWTDARGLYEFDELAPGEVELGFAHAAYVPAESRAQVDESPGLRHELVLDTGWSAAVLVRSVGRGEPLQDVELIAGHVSAMTDKYGQATLEHLVGARVELEVRADGWVGTVLQLRDDGTGRVEVTIELAEGGSIEGTIDDDIGEPVAAARIELRSKSGESLGSTTSDGRGRWRIDGVPEGDLEVFAEPPPALAAELAPVREASDIIRGEVTQSVRLRFERR